MIVTDERTPSGDDVAEPPPALIIVGDADTLDNDGIMYSLTGSPALIGFAKFSVNEPLLKFGSSWHVLSVL